jgi:hypothetical protein
MHLDVIALVQHLRHELDTDPYPLEPRLDPLKAILARLEPPPRHWTPPLPLRPGLAPTHGQKETPMGAEDLI